MCGSSYLFHHINGGWNIVHLAANISRASIALVLGDEICGDKRWDQTLLICNKNAWPIELVILHHLYLKNKKSKSIKFMQYI